MPPAAPCRLRTDRIRDTEPSYNDGPIFVSKLYNSLLSLAVAGATLSGGAAPVPGCGLGALGAAYGGARQTLVAPIHEGSYLSVFSKPKRKYAIHGFFEKIVHCRAPPYAAPTAPKTTPRTGRQLAMMGSAIARSGGRRSRVGREFLQALGELLERVWGFARFLSLRLLRLRVERTRSSVPRAISDFFKKAMDGVLPLKF